MFAVLFVGRFSLLNSFCSLLLALLLASRYFLLWSRCSLFSARSSLSLLATDHLRLTVHLRILLLADNHPSLADCLLSLTGGYLYRVSCHSLHHNSICKTFALFQFISPPCFWGFGSRKLHGDISDLKQKNKVDKCRTLFCSFTAWKKCRNSDVFYSSFGLSPSIKKNVVLRFLFFVVGNLFVESL